MPVSAADMIAPAMACLRVSILGAPPAGQDPAGLQTLVAKIINAFLESRWEWPRQFEQLTPYAFVLTDPRSESMDKRGLKALAAELQVKLFGADGEGEVSLLMFEGSEIEVHRFARLSEEAVERMLAGEPFAPPFEGSIDRITAPVSERPRGALAEALDLETPSQATYDLDGFDDLDILADPPVRPFAPRPEQRLDPCYEGLYLTVSQSFVGALSLCRRRRRDRGVSPDLGQPEALDGLSAEAFDEGCVRSAIEALARDAGGLLFVPLSFSSLVRPAGRRAYARFLCHLPAEQRGRLGAAIYDTPRGPSFFALSTIRRFLDPFFGELNLQVADPAFEVERLMPDMVSSVTLVLRDRDPATRIAAIRRFMQAKDVYKKKRIWAGVSQVQTRAELDLCLNLRAPVVAGPAVAALGPHPVGARSVDIDALPLTGDQASRSARLFYR